jgi:hypothetical protein
VLIDKKYGKIACVEDQKELPDSVCDGMPSRVAAAFEASRRLRRNHPGRIEACAGMGDASIEPPMDIDVKAS